MPERDDDIAVATLKAFYREYITAVSTLPGNEVPDSLKREYFTPRLLRKLAAAELDYDPVVNAQDCDESWLGSIVVTPASYNRGVYNVCYKGFRGQSVCILLKVVTEDGACRIDDIFYEGTSIHKRD